MPLDVLGRTVRNYFSLFLVSFISLHIFLSHHFFLSLSASRVVGDDMGVSSVGQVNSGCRQSRRVFAKGLSYDGRFKIQTVYNLLSMLSSPANILAELVSKLEQRL
jgi:hypothetical protein